MRYRYLSIFRRKEYCISIGKQTRIIAIGQRPSYKGLRERHIKHLGLVKDGRFTLWYRREGSGKRDWWAEHPGTVPVPNLHLRGCPLSVGNQPPAAAYAFHLFPVPIPLAASWLTLDEREQTPHLEWGGRLSWGVGQTLASPAIASHLLPK
jgi:hypothetical protein